MGACDRDELREVSAAVLAVTAHLAVREVLQTIVAAARRLLDAQYAALGIPDGNGSFREFIADGLSDAQWRAIGPIPRQHGLLGAMLHDPSPVRAADIRRHPRFEGWPAGHPEMVDFLGMPIVDGDEILGEIFLANKRPQPGRHGGGGFDAGDEELLRLLAAHAAIAIVNARLYERGRELSIVEERQRIARELHDAVTQKLFSLRLTAEAASALVTRDSQRALAELDTVRRLAAEATAELKSVVVGLRPADLAGDGLATALRRQAELLDRVHAARIRFTGDQVPKLSEERQEAVYRVAQEALHNALRHGDPRHVDIDLRRSGRGCTLRVTDDGTGFDTAGPGGSGGSARPGAAQRRLGLASMRERARSVGGRLTVTSTPGAGTTVTMEVPGDR
ncbi:GAF domain-containing sensor histidine kinase [Dactylosporangium aurantiacum]|uniref:Oxygen sensor histidine kinase NreB n=1 Tax=Dactylosporangium aurantiacum TaxID=35754 RepID=A0A9Q9IK56_9ACTN|nr:GAF domain-containing sensor histidine kinase [Dactylosporangium aurantiacum]MDG6109734.1 GAF domain-containing sensor histidine kinase [Dactylosporangium aurantiacum]UWZ56328.1 GAF domain-containing sensor histidine kinase [Dactylosporangium aurantiacum]